MGHLSSVSRFLSRLTRGTVAVAVTTTVAAATLTATTGVASAEPAPPRDSFYDAPANFAAAAAGQVLKSRPVNVRALQLFPVHVQAWQLLYRTADQYGKPDVTVTTLMIPEGARYKRKLLSFQAATDSILRVCGPSYSLTHGLPIDLYSRTGPITLTNGGAETLLAAAGLTKGWAVAMPDHGGSRNSFLTPHQPGYAVLDGIRAVQNFMPSQLPKKTPTALWGYSGGAIASSWAVEEQPTYAPELNIKGAAFGAPERDLGASLKSVNFTPLAGLIPIALGAIGKDSPAFHARLNQFLTPRGRQIVAETRNHCVGQNVLSNLWFDYRNYLTRPVDVVLNDPIIKKAIAERGITGRAPTVPTYIYNGISEEVAPIAGTDRLVRSYCRGGAAVTFHREQLPPNPIPQISSTHGIVLMTGASAAFDWINTRLTPGAPTPSGCQITTLPSSLLTEQSLQGLGPIVAGSLSAMLGLPVGAR
ncbi:triacylglycerol lipase [Gordonia sp. TBRC 11910]|uniref:Triacylglycerol lipase n=1 Tax=Gordonia asplenii TaxID=2725283 RepID=A0A848KT66_9ACTN|nr:lipase family protein [Gordonia asplenii]NMO01886.1 triacylglycerol lipase [Gordonia asplenii]